MFTFPNSVEMSEKILRCLQPSNFSRLIWAKLTWWSVGSSSTSSERWPPDAPSGQLCYVLVWLRSGYSGNYMPRCCPYPLSSRCLWLLLTWQVFPLQFRSLLPSLFPLLSMYPTSPFTLIPFYSAGASLQVITYFYCTFHWYWAICFQFPLCASDAVGMSF